MHFIGAPTFVDEVFDFSTSPELQGARDVTTTVINGTTYVYVAGEEDDGIQVLTMANNGTLTPGFRIGGSSLDSVQAIEVVERGGAKFLVTMGFQADNIAVFQIDQSTPGEIGDLTFVTQVTDDAGLALNGAYRLEHVTIGARDFLVVAGFSDDGMSVFEIDNSGGLTNVQTLFNTDDPAYKLSAPEGLTQITIDGVTIIAVAGSENGVSTFSMAGNGTLTNLDNFSGTTNSDALGAVTVDGNNYLLTSDTFDDRISVLSIDSSGQVGFVSTIDPGNLGFDNVIHFETFEIDGVPFVAATGNDNVVAILSVDATGTITLAEKAEFFTTVLIGDSHFVEVNGRSFLLSAYEGRNSIQVAELGPGEDPIVGTDGRDLMVGLDNDDDLVGRAGNDDIFGGTGDDVLSGRRGTDKLFGGDGDDVLIGGSGADTLEGGKGVDILRGNLGSDWLSYASSFNGVVVDLSAGTASGGHAEGDIFLEFENLIGSERADTLTGDTADNAIRGGSGGDRLNGGDGEDDLNGNKGADDLYGGAANDLLVGAEGNDRLFGGGGGDDLRGGAGADVIRGGTGGDTLFGSNGADTLVGQADNDTLTGGGGADIFEFADGTGSDEVTDFTTNDRIDFSSVSALNSFADVQGALFEFGGTTIISFTGGAVALLGVAANDLEANDFIF
ncbi:MAG: calcium-binding protein [Pseudomonadota bacterium]